MRSPSGLGKVKPRLFISASIASAILDENLPNMSYTVLDPTNLKISISLHIQSHFLSHHGSFSLEWL
jgi:hypothetical protein